MDIFTIYTTAMTTLIPFFSAIACGILIVFSLQDCLKREEMRLKKIVLLYLSVSGIGWFMTFCYEYIPVLFVWLHIICLITYVLPSILFYRIIRYLTRLGKQELFSPLHYLVPGMLTAVMLTWSLFVPFDVQLEIVTGKAQVFPAGYEVFARFFTIKPLLRVIFGLVYYILLIKMLTGYYKRATEKRVLVRRPARWILFLVGISLASLFSSVLPTIMPRSELLHSLWTLMVAMSISAQHVLLSYHIIRRDYYPYIITGESEQPLRNVPLSSSPQQEPEEEAKGSSEDSTAMHRRRQHAGKLNREIFENFMHKEKPYLNTDYKITDLVDDLDVNRTNLSEFVNRTYGMNFNRYLNRLRLEELRKLRALPDNKGRSISSLIDKAGFKDYRNYSRAVAAEREAAEEQKAIEEQKADNERKSASGKKKSANKEKGGQA